MQNILIVDDVQTEREILGRLVTEAGHCPIYASDGAEVMALAKRVRPALVLLDVVMPGADGFRTCRTLRSDPETRAIPIVLVTSKTSESDRFWAKRQGADDHVGKPYRPEAILSVINRYVG
jgi:twitching motility two-component system response regulator PilH